MACGGINGYSRTVVFLQCSSNNRATTVLNVFNVAVGIYGLPSRIRTDRGGENVEVAKMMLSQPRRGASKGITVCFIILKRQGCWTLRSMYVNEFQEFIMVLIKLRLISLKFPGQLLVMNTCLSPLIAWPTRDALYKTMPQCFVDSFGYKTTVIIDCFEIFINRPTNLLARAQTFSNYEHHNTVKVLISISPQGTISFVSEA